MARTVDYWYDQIFQEKARQPLLDAISSTSRVSMFALIAYVFAFVAWLVDNLFDEHVAENIRLINADKSHRPEWYQTQALAFQYGQGYNKVADGYLNAGLSDSQISAQKIVSQAAVIEGANLRVLVAKNEAGDLAPLSAAELAAFSAYMEVVKDAGVKIDKISLPADSLKLNIDIFYDALILNDSGARIDGTANAPVPDSIRAYLRQLPFNGEYANTRLTDALQLVEGVKLPVIKAAWAKYGLFDFALIDERYIPDAGYIRLSDADLSIQWRPYNV